MPKSNSQAYNNPTPSTTENTSYFLNSPKYTSLPPKHPKPQAALPIETNHVYLIAYSLYHHEKIYNFFISALGLIFIIYMTDHSISHEYYFGNHNYPLRICYLPSIYTLSLDCEASASNSKVNSLPCHTNQWIHL